MRMNPEKLKIKYEIGSVEFAKVIWRNMTFLVSKMHVKSVFKFSLLFNNFFVKKLLKLRTTFGKSLYVTKKFYSQNAKLSGIFGGLQKLTEIKKITAYNGT